MNWTPGTPVLLETDSYTMRNLTEADITPAFLGWFKDPEVMAHVPLPMNLDRAYFQRYLKSQDNIKAFVLGIFDRATGTLVGYYHVEYTPAFKYARTAVIIGERAHWGRRIVVETRTALIDFLFNDLGARKIAGSVNEANAPAVYNYKVQGFQLEGIRREEGQLRDGTWVDLYQFGLLKREWESQKSEREQ